MDIKLVTALIGIAAGALGYWLATFHIQPILRFNDVRNQVLMDFIYYAQVVNAAGLNDEMQKLYRERVLANRKASAQLFAATQSLPCWYRCYLKLKKWAPEEAAKQLIGFSNTTEYEQAAKVQAAIRKKIGLPPET
ncbi:MAG: hypothetical protein E6Q59_10985 [Nitrosomonas sp.]|nr:hypothetical protein [Nitrosomonas sp.]OQW83317.1 MAG: hypothetical protein BVN30_06320 [Proteobacteria bacterium ST_bin16]TXI35464.1 MAG: hypothetical protein E6Q59_10985 [Nitrosomonas sp.]